MKFEDVEIRKIPNGNFFIIELYGYVSFVSSSLGDGKDHVYGAEYIIQCSPLSLQESDKIGDIIGLFDILNFKIDDISSDYKNLSEDLKLEIKERQ